jgi:hypothetical protein
MLMIGAVEEGLTFGTGIEMNLMRCQRSSFLERQTRTISPCNRFVVLMNRAMDSCRYYCYYGKE